MTLRLIDISCVRGNRLLFSQLNFEVHTGQILHLRGVNGAGKSSLLRIIAGLLTPETGMIQWQGRCIKERQNYQTEIAYLGHKIGLKPYLTVLENLEWIGLLQQVKRQNYSLLLKQFALLELQNSLTAHLSDGQKQRLVLAGLAVSNAKLWILDEPSTSLDEQGLIILQEQLMQHQNRDGTVVMASHQTWLFPNMLEFCLSQ